METKGLGACGFTEREAEVESAREVNDGQAQLCPTTRYFWCRVCEQDPRVTLEAVLDNPDMPLGYNNVLCVSRLVEELACLKYYR